MRRLKEIIDWLNRQMLSYAMLLPVLFCSIAIGQTPHNVPDVAKYEIERRGNMVELTGTVRSGLMAAALAPPEDDSAKWFLTIVYKPGDPDSQQVLTMLETSPEAKAWVDVHSSSASVTHYQKRSVDDITQRDWMKGVQKQIDKYGLPMLVLQPPRNKKFGDPATIVKAIHGVVTGKQLSEKLRNGIVDYIKAIDDEQHVAGIRVDRPYADRSADPVQGPPPFDVPPPKEREERRERNKAPFEFPPAKPEALTPEQIEDACPGATPKFIVDTIRSKETDLKVVRLEWLLERSKQQSSQIVAPVDPPRYDDEREVEPAKPFFHDFPTLAAIVAGAVLIGWLAQSLYLWSQEKAGKLVAALEEIRKRDEKTARDLKSITTNDAKNDSSE
jgi:hypothetical protein